MSPSPGQDADPAIPGPGGGGGDEPCPPDATNDRETETPERPFDPSTRPLGMRRAIWVDDDVSNPSLLIPAIVAGLVLALVCLALGQFVLLGVMLAGVAGIVAVAELRS